MIPAKFDEFLTDLSCLYNPQTPAEWALLRRSVEYQWRLDASFAIELAFMDECVNRLAEENEGITYQQAQGLIFLDARFHPRLSLLMRYRAQIDRGYRQATAELERIIDIRIRAGQLAAASSPGTLWRIS